MKREGFRWSVICSVVLIAFGSCHRVDEETLPNSRSGPKKVTPVPGDERRGEGSWAEGLPFPEPAQGADREIDSLWALFPDEPQRSFQGARKDLLSKKSRNSSEKLRRSTMYVNLQTLRAQGPTKAALRDAEISLRELSKEMAQGKISSPGRLDRVFAWTQRSIARLHHEKAKRAYARGDLEAVGIELLAAKTSLIKAAAWTGDQADPALIESTEKAGVLASRLLQSTEHRPAGMRNVLLDFGAQVDRMDLRAESEAARGLFSGEAQSYMKQGEAALVKRDVGEAAAYLRKAASCMALETLGTHTDVKPMLEKEIGGLEQAAKDVENGTLKSPKRLRLYFAKAQNALAKAHHMEAARNLDRHAYERAVTSLQAAVRGIEGSAEWKGKEMKNSSGKALQRVKELSRRVREGDRVSPEEISAAITDLKRLVAKSDSPAVSP